MAFVFFSFSFQYCLLALQFSTLIFSMEISFLKSSVCWSVCFEPCHDHIFPMFGKIYLFYYLIKIQTTPLTWYSSLSCLPILYRFVLSMVPHIFCMIFVVCFFFLKKKLCTLFVFLFTFSTLSLSQKRLLSSPSIILVRLPLCRFIIFHNVYILKSFIFPIQVPSYSN